MSRRTMARSAQRSRAVPCTAPRNLQRKRKQKEKEGKKSEEAPTQDTTTEEPEEAAPSPAPDEKKNAKKEETEQEKEENVPAIFGNKWTRELVKFTRSRIGPHREREEEAVQIKKEARF